MTAPAATVLPPDREHTEWMRNATGTLSHRMRNHSLKPCAHPGATRVALWDPRRRWCELCWPAAVGLCGDEDRRCDRCAVVEDTVTPFMVVKPGLMLFFGLCSTCAKHEGVKS